MLEGAGPGAPQGGRILTDLSGRFFKLVVESEFESLAAWEAWRSTMFSDPAFAEMFAKISELCEGRLAGVLHPGSEDLTPRLGR